MKKSFLQRKREMKRLKEEKIERVKREVAGLGDRLGMDIDEGIKKIVTALRMHDFPTFMSCEGHHEYGCPFPWVDIHVSTEGGESDKLFYLLIKFYTERYVDYGLRLSLVFFPDPSVRLQPSGAWYFKDLEAFRNEMNGFADFLMDEFNAE
ncbi:MAG: hypothetical protein NT098_00020 [Candidatus Parcubacteria bacterium]|nr:hypothetical protein [Candidatus Parcubacteria bacterium]